MLAPSQSCRVAFARGEEPDSPGCAGSSPAQFHTKNESLSSPRNLHEDTAAPRNPATQPFMADRALHTGTAAHHCTRRTRPMGRHPRPRLTVSPGGSEGGLQRDVTAHVSPPVGGTC
ncbi:unnamed protein product [Gadus morhua 'NCC']